MILLSFSTTMETASYKGVHLMRPDVSRLSTSECDVRNRKATYRATTCLIKSNNIVTKTHTLVNENNHTDQTYHINNNNNNNTNEKLCCVWVGWCWLMWRSKGGGWSTIESFSRQYTRRWRTWEQIKTQHKCLHMDHMYIIYDVTWCGEHEHRMSKWTRHIRNIVSLAHSFVKKKKTTTRSHQKKIC